MKKVRYAITIITVIFLSVMFLYGKLMLKTRSRLSSAEDKNIVSVSDNITAYTRSNKTMKNYFIADDKRVYTLVDKELKESEELYGAKKIVQTHYETVVLKDDGSLWDYDEEKKELSEIAEMKDCKDIVNGSLFYAVLKENGEIWTSYNIFKNGDTGEEINYTRIEFPVNIKSVNCVSMFREGWGNCVIAVDENGQMWLCGSRMNDEYDKYADGFTKKVTGYDDIDEVLCAEGHDILFKSGEKFYYLMYDQYGDIYTAMLEYDDNIPKKEDRLVTDFREIRKACYCKEEGGIYVVDDEKIYRIHEGMKFFEYEKDEIGDISDVSCDFKMFPTSYGVIIICDDGKIYLYRNHLENIFNVDNSKNYDMPCREIFSWWDLI